MSRSGTVSVTSVQRVGQRWTGVSVPFILFVLGCQAPVVERVGSSAVTVRFSTSNGVSVPGGWVERDFRRMPAGELGKVELRIAPGERPTRLALACPRSHGGARGERTLAPSALASGAPLSLEMKCDPVDKELKVAVASACPRTRIFVENKVLGDTEQGLLHAAYRLALGPGVERGLLALRIGARSLDESCQLLTPDGVASTDAEQLLRVDVARDVIWVNFTAAPPPRWSPAPGARPRPKSRPYRL